MDSQKLKHLLAIVEHGTFSDAARAVHLTQPALSRSIRSLEDELKAQLFDRGARRARLTVFGELVAERARRIRLEMTQLQRDMELLRGAQEGQLNVGFAPGPAALLLTPFLIHMAQHHPRVKVRTEVSATQTLLESLHHESIDAIVGDGYILRAASNDVEFEPLGDLQALPSNSRGCWRTASSPTRTLVSLATCRLAASSPAGRQANTACRAPGATRNTRSTVALPG